jgi:hypothetical protein
MTPDTINTIQPVCSYLHEEIIGNFQLENTEIKDLGLTGGRVIIRFNYRKFDNEQFKQLNNEFQMKLNKKQELEEKYKAQQKEQLEHNYQKQQQRESVEQAEKANEISTINTSATKEKVDVKKSKLENTDTYTEPMLASVPLTRTNINEQTSAAFLDSIKINSEFLNFKVNTVATHFFRFPKI